MLRVQMLEKWNVIHRSCLSGHAILFIKLFIAMHCGWALMPTSLVALSEYHAVLLSVRTGTITTEWNSRVIAPVVFQASDI
jgi:hypothetical protein